MVTTLMPLDPALSPQRVLRILPISANLLPAEVVAARRARRARRILLVALILAAALLVSWYAYASHRVQVATDDLHTVAGQATELQRSQNRYAEVVGIENQTDTIARQLNTLLADDLPWAGLLSTLRDTGGAAGVSVEGVNGSLTKTIGTSATSGTLPTAKGVTTIGTLIVTGSAPDKPSIAKYVEALGKLDTVANPYLTNASDDSGSISFSINLDITARARCGRFTTACANSGGN